MIYLFAGSNPEAKRQAYQKFLKTLPKDTEVFSISRSDFNPGQIESFYSGAGLFGGTSAVVFLNILENPEAREFLLAKLPEMGESENYFIFLEGKQEKTTLDFFKKARAEINLYDREEKKEARFNSFLLANALDQKDKLTLWIYFRRAVAAGVALEELAGVLFWKVKDMLLKRSFGKFSEAELKKLSGKLALLLPEARRDGRDAEAAFEEYLLEAV